MNYYELLGVNKTSSAQEIKQAYKRLASKHHPDKGGDEAMFKKVLEAYETLSDSKKRAQYDNPQPQWNSYVPPDFGDIFGEFFGQQRQRKNQDAVCDLGISLHEAYRGVERILDIGYDTIKMIVPAGTRHGTSFSLQGKGPKNYPGMPAGDLIVRVHVRNPPEWDRNNDDLIVRVQVDYFQALLGSEVEITHLNGNVLKIKIPARTSPGSRLKLSNYGIPNPDNGMPGNLLVTVDVTSPSLTDTQLQKLQNFIDKEM